MLDFLRLIVARLQQIYLTIHLKLTRPFSRIIHDFRKFLDAVFSFLSPSFKWATKNITLNKVFWFTPSIDNLIPYGNINNTTGDF